MQFLTLLAVAHRPSNSGHGPMSRRVPTAWKKGVGTGRGRSCYRLAEIALRSTNGAQRLRRLVDSARSAGIGVLVGGGGAVALVAAGTVEGHAR
jgi:hypothetical protein